MVRFVVVLMDWSRQGCKEQGRNQSQPVQREPQGKDFWERDSRVCLSGQVSAGVCRE
jgi:hypothetical protein